MSEHEYIDVTHANAHLCFRFDERFIPQVDIGKSLRALVARHCEEAGTLFPDKMRIYTESFSPLAKMEVERILRRHGFTGEVKNDQRTGRYLGSDGYGHYSTDYYEIFRFGSITITE